MSLINKNVKPNKKTINSITNDTKKKLDERGWMGIGTKRKCPKCNSDISYRDKWSYIYAVRDNTNCSKCRNIQNSITHNYSEKFKGKNNPFYGKSHNAITRKKMASTDRSYMTGDNNPMKDCKMKEYFSKLHMGKGNPMYGKRHTKSALKKISYHSSGKNNPMYGKPSPQGSGNGWANWYKGFHFRSLRELQYYINFVDGKGISCESGQTKKFRIPYKDYNGIDRTYSPDFFIDGKFLVEIKPKKLWNTNLVKLKKKVAEKFCKLNGWKYKLIDVDPDSNSIREKYLNGEIKFVEKYKERFERYAKIK
jgi:glutaredoxin